MRFLTAFAFSILATTAIAAEPSYSCKAEQGCIDEPGTTHDIGRGAKITLPSGWKFFSYPTAPLPIMTGLREIRAAKDGMVIAITPFPNFDQRDISESFLCNVATQSGQQYVKQSKELSVRAVPMSNADVVGCYVALTAANEAEKPFHVLPNRRHASVTTFAISYKYIIFSVSVVSEHLPDEDYLAAVDAIRKVQ